jgi:autotransporter translocation and assembly factor TamB
LRKFIFYFLTFFILLLAGLWLLLHSEMFWNWAGYKIIHNINNNYFKGEVAIDPVADTVPSGYSIVYAQMVGEINKNIRGKLTVDSIEGTPFSGLTFKGIHLNTPEGEIFHAKAFMLRISLWSIVTLEPDIEKTVLYNPDLILEKNQQGQWNINQLYHPQGGSSSSIFRYFNFLNFSHISIEHGQVQVRQTGGPEIFKDINLNASLKIFRPTTPVQHLELYKLLLSAVTPWGPYDLKTHLTYDDKHLIKSFDVALHSLNKSILTLSGNRTASGYSNIFGEIGNIPPALSHLLYKKWPASWKEHLTFEIHGSPEDVNFSLNSTIHQASLHSKGVINLAGGKITFTINSQLENLTPEMLFALDVSGAEYYCEASPLSANLHLQGKGLDWPPEEFSLQLKTAPLTYKQAKIDVLSVKISGSKNQQNINAAVCGNFGTLNLISDGSFFTAPQGDIKLEVDLEPAPLSPKVQPGSFIEADFNGKFSLPALTAFKQLVLSGKLNGSGCINGYPLNKLDGAFVWEKNQLNLQGFQAQVGNVVAELKGTLAGEKLNLTTQGKTLPEGDWPVPDTVRGSVTWTGTIQGTLSEPRYLIQAQGQGGLAVGSFAVQSFTLRARGQGLPPSNGTVDLRAAGVTTPAMSFQQITARAQGQGNAWSYQINAASPPAGPTIQVTGTYNLQTQSYAMTGRGQNLAVSSISLQAFTFNVQGQGLPPKTGAINLKATDVKTAAGTFQEVTLAANGQGGLWNYQLKGSSPPPGPMLELAGNANFGSRPMSVVIDRLNVHLANLTVQNQGQIQARFSPGLDLPTATLKVNGGTVQVTARVQGSQASGRLDVHHIPLDIVKVEGLTGTIDSQMTLTGSPSAPILAGEIRLNAVKLKQYALKPVTIVTTIDYRGGQLKIAGNAKGGPGGSSLVWNGKIPVQLSLSPFKFQIANSGLEFIAKSDGANLKLLEPFIPAISEANVPLALVVQANGNYRQPDIEAHISWQQGSITLQQAGIPYTVSAGTLDWHAEKLSLPQLTLESGGGTIVLTANADFKGYTPQRVTARASINDFKVLERLGSEAWLNGNITLNGPPSALVLSGHLTIPKATINPALVQSEMQAGKNPDIILVRHQKAEKTQKAKKSQKQSATAMSDTYKNMSINITVTAPNNVFIKENSTQVKASDELSINIRIIKKPGEALTEAGTIQSLHGKATVFNREFKIDKAIVTLPGTPKQQPYIVARATHEMDDGTMIINITGPVNKPHIEITSDPPKPTNDLMSQLIFGQPASNLSQQQFNAERQAVGVLGGITASKIQNILGGAIPFLGQVSFTGSEGKYILSRKLAPGFKILLEHRNAPAVGGQGAKMDPNVVKLQYRINRYLRLQAEQGARNTGGDIQFKKDF